MLRAHTGVWHHTTMLLTRNHPQPPPQIYSVLLTLRVLLTWFRNISWTSEPFNTIKMFTDPFLSMFR
jgi:hypothetical protein